MRKGHTFCRNAAWNERARLPRPPAPRLNLDRSPSRCWIKVETRPSLGADAFRVTPRWAPLKALWLTRRCPDRPTSTHLFRAVRIGTHSCGCSVAAESLRELIPGSSPRGSPKAHLPHRSAHTAQPGPDCFGHWTGWSHLGNSLITFCSVPKAKRL